MNKPEPEQPNQELMIIKSIQGLISQVNENLRKLDINTTRVSPQHKVLVLQAFANIDSFEKTTLFELQKAFE